MDTIGWVEGMSSGMRKWNTAVWLWLAMGIAACTPDAGSESGSIDPVTGGKGDCPTCDEAGPGAMEQAGISERFYVKGDAWIIAYQRTSRHDMAMEPVLNVEESELPLGAGVQSNRDKTPLFCSTIRSSGCIEPCSRPWEEPMFSGKSHPSWSLPGMCRRFRYPSCSYRMISRNWSPSWRLK